MNCTKCGKEIPPGLLCMFCPPEADRPILYFCSVDCKRAWELETGRRKWYE